MAEPAAAPRSPSSEIVLGFDFGMRRIGVAVGDSLTSNARPLKTLDSTQGPDWKGISALLDTWQPSQLVVGRPLQMDGTSQPMTLAAERFGRRLHGRYHLPVHMAEERMTSIATQHLNVPEGSDAAAAAEILSAWLREHE